MLQDKIVIVTGAFGALGRVVARTLATQGARLALVDAAPAAPDPVVTEFAGHQLLPGIDLSSAQATRAMVAQVVERHGALDAAVNIAGGFRWETIAEGDPATWDLLFTVNLKTALHVCQASLPHLLAAARCAHRQHRRRGSRQGGGGHGRLCGVQVRRAAAD